MNVQTQTAIVPFQGVIKPARSIDYRIMKYSEGDKYRQSEAVSPEYDSGQSAVIYERSGRESTALNSLGKNIDIYI